MISETATLEDLKKLLEVIEMSTYGYTPDRMEFQLKALTEVAQKINDIEFELNTVIC